MTPEARAARERKQKIFVVVGGIFLLGMLALQLPRLLGGSGEPAAATTPPAQVTPAPALPGASTPVVVAASGGRSAVPGKLTTFGAFEKKDPFVQLVVTDAAVGGEAPAEKGEGKAPKGESKSFSVDGAEASAETVVVVNGARQALETGTTFPASDPMFVLVAEQPRSKSIVVGVVGGAYASGSKTTKLVVGKPLTLVNTATGAKYKIMLVSVGSPDGGSEKPGSSK